MSALTLDRVEQYAVENPGTSARIYHPWGSHTGYLSHGGVSGLSVCDARRGRSHKYRRIHERHLTVRVDRGRLEIKVGNRYKPAVEVIK